MNSGTSSLRVSLPRQCKKVDARNTVHYILRVADAYYKTKNLTKCLDGIRSFSVEMNNSNTYKSVISVEFNRNLLFPFLVGDKNPIDFSYYSELNKRMSENLDWYCGHGNMLDCIQQLLIDLSKPEDIEDRDSSKLKDLFAYYSQDV